MSILGSGLGRGLAGLASGAGQLANKYIDEEIQANRAKALAELQTQTAVNTEKALDTYRSDPSRLAAARGEKVKDVEATSAAALSAERTRAADPVLRQAEIDNEVSKKRALSELGRSETTEAGRDPLYLKSLKAIKAADQVPPTRLQVAQEELARLSIADHNRMSHLYDQVLAIGVDESLTQDQKDKKLAPVLKGIQTIKAKTGTAQRDPELDTQTVTEEKMMPDGSVVKTQRKEVRRPGASGGGASTEWADVDALLPPKRGPNQPAKPSAAAAPAKPMAERAGSMSAVPSFETMPEARLSAYTKTHPDYAKAQTELQRRRREEGAAGPAVPYPRQR